MAKFNVETYASYFATYEAKASWSLAEHHVEENNVGLFEEDALDFFSIGVSSADSFVESGHQGEAQDELTPEEELEWARYRAWCAIQNEEARAAYAARRQAQIKEKEDRARWEAAYGRKYRR